VLRHDRRRERRALAAYARAGHPTFLEVQPDTVAGAAVAAALADMRTEHRDALLLLALGELTYEEIAVAMDVPIGTVRGWLSRARATAARELAKHGITPTGARTPAPSPEAMDS